MSCSTSVVKYLVFFFNLIFAIIGLAILIVGVLAKIQNGAVEPTVSQQISLDVPAILLISVGAFVFITAFFGCCGAIKESTCMLTTFAIILLTLLIIQVAVGVYAFLNHDITDEVKSSIKQSVQDMMNKYNSSAPGSNNMDELQKFLHCCGADGPSDWKWPESRLPMSCCRNEESTCTQNSDDKYTEGCAEIGRAHV